MAFDGLAEETYFIRSYLISFMNGTSNTVVMTDCNHAANNIRSQLVLGSDIVTGGNALFDVGILRLAGVPIDLYRVSDYASDVLILKLCRSNTIDKLLNVILTSKEDPLNVAFMAISLYFLRTFICAYNADDINSEGQITMLWSALMWFSSLEGVSKVSKNNLITSCLGGIFLAIRKKIRNLCLTTTEPLEHTFGTTRSWRREFTINEFLTYSNKVDIILKNVIESGFHTSSSNKGYMHGFKGFADVVSKIKHKLMKKTVLPDEDNWAVDIDYNGPPIIDQIHDKIISAIRRIKIPVFNIMKVFGMQQLSLYCTEVYSVKDLINIYQSSSKHQQNLLSSTSQSVLQQKVNIEEILQRLSNLALDFNNGNGAKLTSTNEIIDTQKNYT